MCHILYARYIVAVGTESGRIALYSWYLNEDGSRSGGWNLLHAFDQSYPLHVYIVENSSNFAILYISFLQDSIDFIS